ncbi:MAG TPA: RNA polymerase sigma factor [Solirubrobacteraceae bacterium]|nr:RNA polymerase sigma factor [Solirubrobacteraceae bacterium]
MEGALVLGMETGPRSRRFLRAASDDRLVARLRQGHEDAFEVIYDRYNRGMLSYCRHMLGSVDEAEDAAQQTFVSAYRDLLASDRPVVLRPWLYTIARNRCLSMLRARRDGVALDDVQPATEGLAEEVQRRADLRELLADLARLPVDQRSALLLAELGAHPHEEIGMIMGVRREKVKALVFQARESLAGQRDARSIPCAEIRRELAVASGPALRRAPLRRHVAECAGCRAFSQEVRRQRAAIAVVLPVLPSLVLRHNILAAAFAAGHGATIAGGSGAAVGGSAAAGGANGATAATAGGANGATAATASGSGAAATSAGGGAASGGVAASGGGTLVALAGKGLAVKVLAGALLLGGVSGAGYLTLHVAHGHPSSPLVSAENVSSANGAGAAGSGLPLGLGVVGSAGLLPSSAGAVAPSWVTEAPRSTAAVGPAVAERGAGALGLQLVDRSRAVLQRRARRAHLRRHRHRYAAAHRHRGSSVQQISARHNSAPGRSSRPSGGGGGGGPGAGRPAGAAPGGTGHPRPGAGGGAPPAGGSSPSAGGGPGPASGSGGGGSGGGDHGHGGPGHGGGQGDQGGNGGQGAQGDQGGGQGGQGGQGGHGGQGDQGGHGGLGRQGDQGGQGGHGGQGGGQGGQGDQGGQGGQGGNGAGGGH